MMPDLGRQPSLSGKPGAISSVYVDVQFTRIHFIHRPWALSPRLSHPHRVKWAGGDRNNDTSFSVPPLSQR